MKKLVSFVLAIMMLALAVVGNFSLALFAEESEIDLVEYPRKSTEVGWGDLGINKGLDGGKIDVTDASGKVQVYEKGMTAHAPSMLTYDVSGKFITRVTATCGVERASNNAYLNASTVGFKIIADGVVIYESPVVTDAKGSIDIDVAIPGGTKTLVLATTSGGDSNTGDHSVWVNPKMYSDPSIKDQFSGMKFSCDKTILMEGETVQTSMTATTNNDDPIVAESIKYVSSDSKVVTVSDQGLITAIGAGYATVTCELRYQGKTYSKSVPMAVMAKDSEAKQWQLTSPDGKVMMVLTRDKMGHLSYKVSTDKALSLPEGTLGVKTDLCDFSEGLLYVSESKVTEHNETFKVISGKRSEILDHYKEITVTFEKQDYYFDVILRAYDDGFANRFVIRAKDGGKDTLVVLEETSDYTLPAGSTIYAEKVTKDEMENRFCYETSYSERKIEQANGAYLAFPLLYTAGDDQYVLLCESDLYTDVYPGSVTYGIGNNKLKLNFAPVVSKTVVETSFTSPWRWGITGDLGTIVESDMSEKLVERTTEDFSWVEPGVTAWMWLSEGYGGQRDYNTIKRYVDLASAFKWKYLILDEGWQPNAPAGTGKAYQGVFPWFDDLVKYAEEKGVGLLVWVKYIDLNTTERLDFLNELAGYGIKGIKADFFDNENQATLAQMKAIYERCAELKMVVNCHGANKPTGERIQYPNILNREAVNGEEYGGYDGFNLTVWPYTRGVVGPMDLTPRLTPTGTGTTSGAQLAMNVLYECGIPCMASSWSEYYKSIAKPFLVGLPAAWDDTHYIGGEIGKHTMIARRSGDLWYAAAIAKDMTKGLEMPLDFLEEGVTYKAVIYQDGAGRTNLIAKSQTVTSESVLSFNLLAGGGYTVMMTPVNAGGNAGGEGEGSGTENDGTANLPGDGSVVKPGEGTDEGSDAGNNTNDETKKNNTAGGPSQVVVIVAVIAAVVIGGVAGFLAVRKKKH
ncbi:MAG: hypothetical protein E7599_05515 [Ruminococcaceae bacterium]|nr:hypothetical protein [Oscillospiraceae bacterium]